MASEMLAIRRLFQLTPTRRAIALASLGALPVILILVLMLVSTTAGAESIDIYEFETLEATHGAEAVAVRADGNEAVVLTSLRNDTTGYYDNYVYSTSGTGLTERASWTGQSWRWTCAAFDPSAQNALLGGSRGMLYNYLQGSVTRVTTTYSYDFTAIDWHPYNHMAYLGVTTSIIFKYSSGTVSIEVYTSGRVNDLDVRPDGGEIVISSYYYVDIYNISRSDLTQLDRPVEDEYEYYYCYGVEYSNDGSYFLASWYDWNSYTLFRYINTKWQKVANTAGAVNDIRFENEGSFALLGLSNNCQYVAGNSIGSAPEWYNQGTSMVMDFDFNDKDFYFLVGTDSKVLKLRRKDNVRPWLDRPIPDVTIDEDVLKAGDNLIDLLNYVKDDRTFSKLRFEFDYQQDQSLVRGTVDGHYLDFEQMVENWYGKMAFRLKVWDQGFDDVEGNFDDESNRTNMFNVTIRAVNDPVTLVSLGDRIIGEDSLVFFVNEGEVMNLTITVHDVDDSPRGTQPPHFSFNRTLPSIKVDTKSMMLSFVPRNKDVGTVDITLLVSDGFGSTDEAGLTFHVRNVNNPARLLAIRDRTVAEDSWLNFTVTARDEDLEIGVPDVITFSTNLTDGVGDDDLPNFGFVTEPGNPTAIMVSFLPTNENVGVIMVEFRVRDGSSSTWQDTRSMTITVENTNDAPVLVELSGVSLIGITEYPMVAPEDEELSIAVLARDDDRDPLFFYVDDPRFQLEQHGLVANIRFTPTNADVGLIFVTLSVWDVFNTFDQLLLNVSVVNVNDPPVIVTFEAEDVTDLDELHFTLYEDVLFTAPMIILDIDSDRLTISDREGVFTFRIDPNDPHRALANFTPTQDQMGVIETVIEVDDGDGAVDMLALVLTVLGTNDPPTVPEITQLDLNSLTIPMRSTRATDPDGDELTYTWDFGDHGSQDTGVDLVEVEHTYARSGKYLVIVTVTDGRGGVSVAQQEILVPDIVETPEETEVEEGPVALVATLVIVFAVVAVVLLFLYMRMTTRRTE